MMIDSISPLFLKTNIQSTELTKNPDTSFSQWLNEKISATNDQLNHADQALTELATGHADNLHKTMLALEEAKLSFQYLEQIRNRLMSAYQELLREQI